jgi:hypothetical protein
MPRELPEEFWSDFLGNGEVSLDEIILAEKKLGFSFPKDYIEFLLLSNGGEGSWRERYFILWRVQDLCQFNIEYESHIYAPGLVLFGSNGGGEAYAFDTRSSDLPIVEVPFVGMSLSYATKIADGFAMLFKDCST